MTLPDHALAGEAKAEQQALDVLYRRYRLFLQTARDAIHVLDEEGNLREWNDAFLAHLGYTAEEAARLNVADWDAHFDQVELQVRLKSLLKEGRTFETVHRRKDGVLRMVEVSASGMVLDGKPWVVAAARDITERKQVEQQVHDSEAKWRSYMASAPVGILVADRNGRHVEANPAIEEMLGYAPGELKGTSVREIPAPESLPLAEAHFARVQSTGTAEAEFALRRKNDERVWASIRGTRINDDLFLAVVQDLTRQQLAKQTLEEANSRQRATLESTADGILVVDCEGRFTDFNEKFLELWRFPMDLVPLGRQQDLVAALNSETSLHHLFSQLKDPKEFGRRVQELYAAPEMTGFDIIEFRDGRVLERFSVPQRLAGKVVGRVWSFRDATERRRAQVALEQSAQSYKGLFNAITDAIYIQDEQGCFLDVNDGAVAMYGYAREEFVGRTPEFLSAPGRNDLAQVVSLIQQAFAGTPQQFEFWGLRKNGEVFPKDVRLQVGSYFGQRVLIAVAREIATRKQAESALRRFERITNTSTDLVALIGADFRYLLVNDAYLKARRLRSEDMIGHEMREIVGNERFEREARAQIERCLRGEEFDVLEWNDFGAGRRFFHHVRLTPCREPDGTVSSVVMMGRDITALKMAEEALRQERDFAVNLTNALGHGVTTTNADGVFEFVNPAYARMLGLPVEAIVGRTLADFAAPADQVANGQGTHEIQLRHADGHLVPAMITSVPRWRDGQMVGAIAVVADLTGNKAAEAEIRRAAAYNRSLIEASLDPLVTIGADGRITDVNQATEKATGFSRDVLIGADFANCFTEPERAREGYKQVFQHGLVRDYPLEIKHRDGRSLSVHYNASIYRDQTGRVLGVFAAARDVSERRRNETRMAALQKLGVALNEAREPVNAGQAVAAAALDIWNWDACFILRYDESGGIISEIVNMDTIGGQRVSVPVTLHNAVPSPLIREVLQSGPKLILRRQPDDPAGISVRFGDLTRPSMSLMYAPIRFEGRKVGIVSIQSYSRDAYTEEDLRMLQTLADHCAGALVRVQAEAELLASERRFASIFRNSPVGICLVRAADDRILDINTAMTNIFGYTREEAVGRTAFQLNAWVEPRQGELLRERLIQAGRIEEVNLTIRRRNGEIAQLAGAAELIEIAGERCLLLFARDITEFNRAQEGMRQAQKMESIGHLAGGVAHHFNNILAAMTLNLSLLREKLADPEAAYMLRLMLDLSKDAAGLVGQLLAYGRKSVLQVKPCDFQQMVGASCRLLRPLLGEKIALELTIGGDVPWIEGDRSLLDQVLMNLCLNARDAMPEGGRLQIQVGIVLVDEARARLHPKARVGRFACLAVSDTGCGMTPATLQHLFEPFFTTKPVGRGTGLGLATAYGIVEQHRGWIEVESQVGRGSTFRVLLPTIEPVADQDTATVATELRKGGEAILLVEDEPAVRRALASYLRHRGYQVFEAGNAIEARHVWERNAGKINLLFTDMVMPDGENGRELAVRFRAESPGLKVVLSSGYSLELASSSAPTGEDFLCLPKPFSVEELNSALVRCLGQEAG